jgi:hypothetical protein
MRDLGEGIPELFGGEIVAMPPATPPHGRIGLKIGMLLLPGGDRTGLGHAASNESCVRVDPSPSTAAKIPTAQVLGGSKSLEYDPELTGLARGLSEIFA